MNKRDIELITESYYSIVNEGSMFDEQTFYVSYKNPNGSYETIENTFPNRQEAKTYAEHDEYRRGRPIHISTEDPSERSGIAQAADTKRKQEEQSQKELLQKTMQLGKEGIGKEKNLKGEWLIVNKDRYPHGGAMTHVPIYYVVKDMGETLLVQPFTKQGALSNPEEMERWKFKLPSEEEKNKKLSRY